MTPSSGAPARHLAVLCLSLFLIVGSRSSAAAEDTDPAAIHQSAFAVTLFARICVEKIGRPMEAQAMLEALPLNLASIAGEDLPILSIEPGETVKAWAVASPSGPVLIALIDNRRCVVQAAPVDGPSMREMLDTIVHGLGGPAAPLALKQHETRNVAMGDGEAIQEYWVLDGRPDGVKLMFIALGPGESSAMGDRWMRLTASLAK